MLFVILTRKTNTWLNIALVVAIFSSDMQNIVEIDWMPLLTAKNVGNVFFFFSLLKVIKHIHVIFHDCTIICILAFSFIHPCCPKPFLEQPCDLGLDQAIEPSVKTA